MPDCVLALDVGGTSVKLALAGLDGIPLKGTAGQLTFNSQAGQAEILGVFHQAAMSGKSAADAAGHAIAGCGIAFPGPFDFIAGISRMEHKMPAIRDIPLTPVFTEPLGGIPIRYLHDSTAWLLGEASAGAASRASSPAIVMLGTGFGFAYMKNGRVRIGHDQRPHVTLWNAPYRDGIVEDYISRRAIRQRYARMAGTDAPPDVEGIAALAREGDRAAAQTMYDTGLLLADILCPVLTGLNCDMLIIGGQIARSADLFLGAVREGVPIPVHAAGRLDDAALCGAARYCLLPRSDTVEEVER